MEREGRGWTGGLCELEPAGLGDSSAMTSGLPVRFMDY